MTKQDLELIDYLEVMWRQRWLIAATMIAAILASAVVGARRPGAHVASVSFDTGVPNDKRQEESFRRALAALERKWQGTAVTISAPLPGQVRLQATGTSADAARAALQPAAAATREALSVLVERERTRVSALEHELEFLRSLASSLRAAQIRSLEKPGADGALLLQMTSAEIERTNYRMKEIEDELGPAPSLTASDATVTPAQGFSLRLLLVVAVLTGAAVSMVLAFLVDYVRVTRRARQEPVVVSGGRQG